MKASSDLFGQAVYAYSKGNRTPLYFLDAKGKRYPHNLKRYFRTSYTLKRLDKKLIALAKGRMLDVGCATGNYIPALEKRGKVTGIDVSPSLIRVAQENGRRECRVADIFSFKPKHKFNTITLLENNFGMAGSLSRTKLFLAKLASLLVKDGQILGTIRKNVSGNYVRVTLTPLWKGKRGRTFMWINYDKEYLAMLCEKAGLRLEVLDQDHHDYLIRMKPTT